MGRHKTFTDDAIVEAVESGIDTVDGLLDALGMRHKSTLIARLRELDALGRLTLVVRARRDGFRVYER